MIERRPALLLTMLAGALAIAGCKSAAPLYSPGSIGPVYTRQFTLNLDRKFQKLHEEGKLVPREQLAAGSPATCAAVVLPSPATGRLLAGPELFRKVMQSTVKVGKPRECTNPNCSIGVHFQGASGVVISEDGVVVTNAHVIDKDSGLGFGIATADGQCYAVTGIIAVDPKNDVAILQTAARGLPALAISPFSPVGTPVAVVSHPKGEHYEYSAGVVTNYCHRAPTADGQSRPRGPEDMALRMTISADFAKGSSGGPVVDFHGRLVGLVQATEAIYYVEEKDKRDHIQMVRKQCVPSHAILALLGRIQPPAFPHPEDCEDTEQEE